MFNKWLSIGAYIAKNCEESSTVVCPNCGEKTIDYLYIGDEKTKIGYVQIWCNECLNGIQISRTSIPEKARLIPFGADVDLTKIVPEFKRVTPN